MPSTHCRPGRRRHVVDDTAVRASVAAFHDTLRSGHRYGAVTYEQERTLARTLAIEFGEREATQWYCAGAIFKTEPARDNDWLACVETFVEKLAPRKLSEPEYGIDEVFLAVASPLARDGVHEMRCGGASDEVSARLCLGRRFPTAARWLDYEDHGARARGAPSLDALAKLAEETCKDVRAKCVSAASARAWAEATSPGFSEWTDASFLLS